MLVKIAQKIRKIIEIIWKNVQNVMKIFENM